MTQWEYLTAYPTDDLLFRNDLYETLGKDGWELVTIISRPGLPERAVFKRPIAAAGAAKVAAKKGAK